MDPNCTPPAEVQAFYDAYPEESRLQNGPFQLEFERTKEIFARVLPPPPARVVDVGGAAGAYSFLLADRGYQVHLVDGSPRLIDEARTRNARATIPLASISLADARQLPQAADSADAVLVMGPLYHLTEHVDRIAALSEAFRVVVDGGVVAVAAISRYASTMDGLARRIRDPQFIAIRDRDLFDGQHRNDTGTLNYFTTAYFHRPDDLRGELEAVGFGAVSILGVEGPAWILPDFNDRWADAALRQDLVDIARILEAEPSMVGMSAHLLAVARKNAR